MADIIFKESSQLSSLIGMNTSGIETDYVGSTPNNELLANDVIRTNGVSGAITVSTTAVLAKVGGSAHPNRKFLSIYNDSNNTIYWSFSASVTTSGANKGTPIFKEQLFMFNFGIPVYLIAGSSSSVIISEGA